MKRFMKLMSVVFVLGAMATASTVLGEGSEASQVKSSNPTDVHGQHCDSLERLLGMCRSSENILN